MGRVAELHAEIIDLHTVQEMKVKDIAIKLHVPVEYVYSTIDAYKAENDRDAVKKVEVLWC